VAGLEVEAGPSIEGEAVGLAVAAALLHPGLELVIEDLEDVGGKGPFEEQVAVTLELIDLRLRKCAHAESSLS
jgi:hypothetical protein